jgi:hypothetical protein
MSDQSSDEPRPVDTGHLREDMVYAAAVLEAAKKLGPPEPSPGIFARAVEFLSSGLGLLIIGTILTSVLIPYYQKAAEQRQAEREIMRDCLAEFLQYEVSIWNEYYAVFPLIHESELDREKYDGFTAQISEIKIERYRAYAKVKANAIAFRGEGSASSVIETEIHNFAVLLNQTSETIDRWMGDLYCSGTICGGEEGRGVDSRTVMADLGRTMQKIECNATVVSEMMVRRIQGQLDLGEEEIQVAHDQCEAELSSPPATDGSSPPARY